jgi:hypothetical protein
MFTTCFSNSSLQFTVLLIDFSSVPCVALLNIFVFVDAPAFSLAVGHSDYLWTKYFHGRGKRCFLLRFYYEREMS